MVKWNVTALKIVLTILFLSAFTALQANAGGDEDESCMACHQTEKPIVDRALLGQSAHRNLVCTDCHEGAEDHYQTDIKPEPVRCGSCHEAASAEYEKSDHAQAAAQGVRGAAGCADCRIGVGCNRNIRLNSSSEHLFEDLSRDLFVCSP